MEEYSGQKDLVYYPSGQIKSYVTLVEDRFAIGDAVLVALPETLIEFYESGALKKITLAQEARLESGFWTNFKFNMGDTLEFLETGKIKHRTVGHDPES